MKSCLIIDDEPLARALVKEYLLKHPEIQVLGEYGDGFAGFKAIQELKPDLIFLDIQMPKITGFEMLELIEEPPAVIFCTAYDSFALKAFDAHAIDYLLKPFSQERFDGAIQRFNQFSGTQSVQVKNLLEDVSAMKENRGRITVKQGGQIRIIPCEQIIRIEANDDYVKIFIQDEYFLKKTTLSQLERMLEKEGFVRVHRSHMVPLNQITSLDGADFALLKNGAKVPLSKTGYQRLKETLNW